MRNQCSLSRLTAIEAWVLLSSGFSLRAFLQTGHPQFHCGTPPPAAAPRTTTRSMVRLLEKAALKVDTNAPTILLGSRYAWKSTSSHKSTLSAYLRAAHAYMLISM